MSGDERRRARERAMRADPGDVEARCAHAAEVVRSGSVDAETFTVRGVVGALDADALCDLLGLPRRCFA